MNKNILQVIKKYSLVRISYKYYCLPEVKADYLNISVSVWILLNGFKLYFKNIFLLPLYLFCPNYSIWRNFCILFKIVHYIFLLKSTQTLISEIHALNLLSI